MIDSFLEFDFFDWLGIMGSLLIAGAYYCVSNEYFSPKNFLYHLINLIGSFSILISLYYKPNPGAIIIELLWVIIAISSIYKYFLKG